MAGVERELAAINAKLRLLLNRFGEGQQRLLTERQAAQRLGIPAKRLALMVRYGLILTCPSDGKTLIPASEVTRIALSAEFVQSAQSPTPRLRLVPLRVKR